MRKKWTLLKKICVTGLVALTTIGTVSLPLVINPVNVQAAEKKNGWKKEKGGWKYYKDGKAYTGWHKMGKTEGEITEHWSYFGKDGVLRTGWQKLGKADGEKTEHWSYFGGNGWLRTGWQKLGKADGEKTEHWSYFGGNGWLRTGWQKLGKADGEKIEHWSYFGPNGWLRTGWQEMGSGTANPDGKKVKHISYFGGNGWLRVGLNTIDGKKYIFSKNNNGKTYAGWLLFDYSKNKSYSYTWGTGGLNYVRAVAHRGYNDGIPENSLAAFKEAKNRGFEYVETDIAITRDGVYVLSHDETINRCGRNQNGTLITRSIYIRDINYNDLLKYDFGIYKSNNFRGTKIASFEEFLKLCKQLKLKPYIHLKENIKLDEKNIQEIVNLVKKYNMEDEVTWISFSVDLLNYVNIPKARKGVLIYGPIDQGTIDTVVKMKKQGYDAYISVGYKYYPTDAEVKKCIGNDIPIQCWTINNLDEMKKMNSYVSGITSDCINAVKLYEN